MNRTFDTTYDSLTTPAIAELDVATGRVVERARRGRDDASTESPVRAVDAMALCMAASAIGG